MINELLLRVEYEGSTYDLIVDNEVPLRIDMSAVESQELGKFFGIGSQTFNLPGTKDTNRFFNYTYDVSTDDIPGFYNTLECSVILNGETAADSNCLIVPLLKMNQLVADLFQRVMASMLHTRNRDGKAKTFRQMQIDVRPDVVRSDGPLLPSWEHNADVFSRPDSVP